MALCVKRAIAVRRLIAGLVASAVVICIASQENSTCIIRRYAVDLQRCSPALDAEEILGGFCRGFLWASNSIRHYLPDCNRVGLRRAVFLRIVPCGRKRFTALCQACLKRLLLPWHEVGRRLSLPSGMLPKVGAGQKCSSSVEQDQQRDLGREQGIIALLGCHFDRR